MHSTDSTLTTLERRAAFSLAGIFAFRMIGLFMLLPVMATFGQYLDGYSPQSVGLAIGIYGLVQGVLMIPLGKLSDRYGRKPIMVCGLILFAAGAAIAALSTHIYGVIAGRALQGAGAIAGVVLALAADLTAEQRRSKVMAIIGMTIGASFLLAFACGPLLAAHGGLPLVFWVTCIMAIAGLTLTLFVVPTEPRHVAASNQSWVLLWQLLQAGALTRLSLGIFVLHAIMAALFVAMPLQLLAAGVVNAKHGAVYLPVLLVSALVMMPLLRRAEKRQQQKNYLLAMIGLMAIALLIAAAITSIAGLVIALLLFFIAFNWLEACLPSWVSRVVPANAKGTAMGFYTSAQFFGAFTGGAGAGGLFAAAGPSAVYAMAIVLCLIWWLFSWSLSPLPTANVANNNDELARLQGLEGDSAIVDVTAVKNTTD